MGLEWGLNGVIKGITRGSLNLPPVLWIIIWIINYALVKVVVNKFYSTNGDVFNMIILNTIHGGVNKLLSKHSEV